MSFREKSAWISLASITLASGFFFLHVPRTLTPAFDPRLGRGMFYCVAALIIIEIVAHLVVAARSPRDARTPKDERERLIDLKATHWAYYVYVVGSLAGVSMMHHGANKTAIGFLVLLAFVVAEITKNAVRIVYHRRGF